MATTSGHAACPEPSAGSMGLEQMCEEKEDHPESELLEAAEESETDTTVKDPLLFCSLIVRYPKTAFGLTLGGHIFLSVLNVILWACGYDILPVDFKSFPVELKGEIIAQREYAWNLRDEDPDTIHRVTIDNIGPHWNRGRSVDNVTLFYSMPNAHENIFKRDFLIQMKEVESKLFEMKNYQKYFCQLNTEDGNCTKPTSLLRYFDGTYTTLSPKLYDPDFQNISSVLYVAYTHPKTRDSFKYFLPKGFKITPHEAFGNLTRCFFPVGWPLETGTSEENEERIKTFLNEEMVPAIENQGKNLKKGLTLNYYSWNIFKVNAPAQAMKDMLLAICSFIFIFCFMWFQTGSLWITGWSVLSVETSFCITNLIYRIVLDYRFIGYFHIISIFIILGIGADDIFVFFNTWKASAYVRYNTLEHRLSDCYRRAGGTMFFTSFTTMMAFAASGISPKLPISSFGVFTAILVAVIYISVIVFFPTVLITYHLHFDKPLICTKKRVKTKGDVKDPETTQLRREKLVIFFRDYYFYFITHRFVRWIVILVFLAVISFLFWSALKLEVSTEEMKIFRRETNLGKAMSLAGTYFIPSGESFVAVYLVWGMRPRDFSSCHKTDHKSNGEQIWTETFDMNTPPAQLALLKLCNELKHGLSQAEIESLMIQNNSLSGQPEVDCFIENMMDYLKNEANLKSMTLNFPLMQKNMDAFMQLYPNLYDLDNLPAEFYRYFEVGVGHWLSDGYSLISSPDFILYNSLIGEARDGNNTRPIQLKTANASLAYYGTKLWYAAIRVNLSLSTQELNYIKGLPVMEEWENFFHQKVSQMPLALRDGFQTTDHIWHWLKIQETLNYTAVYGVVLGLCIALLVLILATMNIITGVFATIIIGCNTVAALGILPLANWKLDIMVSMNLCLLVGLSVDYVVHLAEGYHLSAHKDRLGRVHDMLEHLGISVLSGALTTIGAAIPMVFAKIQFFLQFGSFLLCVIGFSMFFSLVFFTAIMGVIGPQGEIGSLYPIFRNVAQKLKAWTGLSKVPCERCKARDNNQIM